MTAPRQSSAAASLGAVTASTVAGGLLGVLSNVLLAARFGRGVATDAFFMAQSLPLLFGKFFQTGPLPQVVMPIFLEARAQGRERAASRYASSMITVVVLAAAVSSAVVWFAAPWLIRLLAPGFDGETRSLTIGLARLLVPVLLCTVLISLLTGFLNASRIFAWPEWLARLPSLALIAVMAAGAAWLRIEALAWALAVGSLVQLGLLWLVGTRRRALAYQPLVAWREEAFQTTWRRLSPFLLSAAVVQAQLVVHRLVTSLQPLGTLSALSYAERISNFLVALLGAVPMVLFPQFIHDALAADRAVLRRRLTRMAGLVALLSFPMAVGLIVVSEPFIRLLFERGRFDALATRETALALGCLAVGVAASGLAGLCKAVAYAVQRPALVNITVIGASAAAMALTLTLGRWWGLPGLALVWGLVPYLVAAGYLWQLRRDVPAIHQVVWNGTVARIALAACGMGALCWVVRQGLGTPPAWWHQALGLGLTVLVGAGSYWGLLSGLGVQERHELVAVLRRATGLARPQPVSPAARVPQSDQVVAVESF
ncbi:MAG: polysaccharide biosynthesis C-terminal domain-containing protein [Candidatus Omnitrophica bacterium]|nr:polysaccharide biosynthesis C-terminal domain-containing protein [Candidatus Omnitrophota bacterium]